MKTPEALWFLAEESDAVAATPKRLRIREE